MRARKRTTQHPAGGIDAVLLGALLALTAVGGALLWLSPSWWGYYLMMLDVRIWTPWKAAGLVIVLMEILLVVRHWPNSNSTR